MAKLIVHSRVEPDVYRALVQQASEQDRTVSAVIARILRAALIRSTK